MAFFDIASGTQVAQPRDVMAGRALQRAQADLTKQQARLSKQDADYLDKAGSSQLKEERAIEEGRQELQAQQERRLAATTAYNQANTKAMEIAEYASKIAANTGELTPEMEELFRTNMEETTLPFATLMDQQRGEAFVSNDPNYEKFPNFSTVQGQYQSILDMAVAEGRSEYMAQQMEDGGTALEKLQDLWTPTQVAEHQEVVRTTQSQLRVISDVTGLVEQLALQGEEPSAIFGTQGAILGVAGTIRDSIGAGAKYAVKVIGADGETLLDGPPDTDLELAALASQDSRIRKALEEIEIPETITSGEERARYRSAIVQLAYAQARAVEPNARQLSNQDFAMALEMIGANSANPRSMLITVLDNLGRNMEDLSARANQAYTRGEHESVGLSKRDVNMLLFGTKDMDAFLNAEQSARQRIDTLINKTPPVVDEDTGFEVGSTEWLRHIRDQALEAGSE